MKPRTEIRLPPCPPLKLSADPPSNWSLTSKGPLAIDVLYTHPVIQDVQRLAIEIGTRAARAHWYRLRRRIIRLMDYCARYGHTLMWEYPWPDVRFGRLAIHVHIRANGRRIIGRGDVT